MSNAKEKPKVTATALIEKLENEKGITFHYINKQNAARYLIEKNNYLRTASYRKNYPKHLNGSQNGKYINLDFAYLIELSIIDMYFRELLLNMCIDVEHDLKVKIISDVEKNNAEDGYNIVKLFLKAYPATLRNIEQKIDSVFVGPLINNYFEIVQVFTTHSDEKEASLKNRILSVDCPVWAFLEIISFGNLIKFAEFYYHYYYHNLPACYKFSVLNPVKSLRNACAHNNCLLNNLTTRNVSPPADITKFAAHRLKITRNQRKRCLSLRPIFEFTTLLYLYDTIVSEKVRKHGIDKLSHFINGRMCEKASYFKENNTLTETYNYLKKCVDNLCD